MQAVSHAHDHHDEIDSKVTFGFWVYLMSDCLLFASIFAVYAVMHTHVYGGVSGKDIFEMPYVLVETFLLLISSFTYGLAMLALHKGCQKQVLIWLAVTFALGVGFLCMEVNEFHNLIAEGHGPQQSAFLSSFFTLVGTHGLHVLCGLIWMVILFIQVLVHGISGGKIKTKLTCLSMFWHFLDIIWILVFTIVYLMGVM